MDQYHNPRRPVKTPNPYAIRLEPIARHEKLAYIESVFAALIDSRFEPGRSDAMFAELRMRSRNAPAIDRDIAIEDPVAWHSVYSNAVSTRGSMTEVLPCELSGQTYFSKAARGETCLQANHGRGSP